jgi:ClpP class serine protease
MAIVEEGEYKGSPMLVLKNTEEDRWPFQFGLKKAKLIMEHIEEIKQFVQKHDKTETK